MSGTFLQFQVGRAVSYKQRMHVILKVLDFDSVLISDLATKETVVVKPVEIVSDGHVAEIRRPDLSSIPEERWAIAQRRHQVIKPLLNMVGRTKAIVAARAEEFQLTSKTVYQWLSAYESTGLISSLLPSPRKDKGVTRIRLEVENVIKKIVEDEYLTSQRKSVESVAREVKSACLKLGVHAPHPNTVRNRIRSLSEELKIAKREGQKVADGSFKPILGNFPGADWPLSVVEIDHTKVDIILVDDIYRKEIGRPWITVAIDVFSRMVLGFYVSFDPPGALATGLCLASAILSKEDWLTKHNIGDEWPCWGVPNKIHMDNAKEFRGIMLQKACLEYGIEIEWRPVARPHFGGQIERLMGTLMKEVHTLPGTTFSNPQVKGSYDSEENASLSLAEFETWLTTYIIQVYHKKKHESLGMSPIEKYRRGIFGDGTNLGIGMPARVLDPPKLRLDFTPFFERSILPYGVVIDEVLYFHDVLRRWINATDPKDPKYKRKFIFRRDPRDLSTIWFYDPDLNCYYPIPYRNTSYPSISIWELRETKKRLEADGRKNIDEVAIFQAYDRMREIEKIAKGKTASVRKAQQRRAGRPSRPAKNPESQPVNFTLDQVVDEEILPFDELDEMR